MTTAKKAPAKDEPRNIHRRILDIMADAEITKTGVAPKEAGGFAYHAIDEIEGMLKPLLVKHGVTAIPSVIDLQMSSNGGWNSALANVQIAFVNSSSPNDRLDVFCFGHGLDKQDKAIGKAISYATKTAYLSVFHLRGQPDVEAHASEQHVPASAGAVKDDLKELGAIAKDNGWTRAEYLEACKREWGKLPTKFSKRDLAAAKIYFSSVTPATAQDDGQDIPSPNAEGDDLPF